MIIHNCEQNSDAWDSIRLGKLTGSHGQEVGNAAKGLDSYVEKIILKMINPDSEGYNGPQMQRGTDLEPVARKAYEFETGNQVTEVGFIESEVTDEVSSDRCGCSPDGLVGSEGMIECKARNASIHLNLLRGGNVDSKTIWQMNYNMLISGRKWCDFVSYNPDFVDSLFIKRFERDEDKIKKLIFGTSKGTNLINNELSDPVVIRQIRK